VVARRWGLEVEGAGGPFASTGLWLRSIVRRVRARARASDFDRMVDFI
jgi:hypothetical protein